MGDFLIAAASLKTPTRNGYNAQCVNFTICSCRQKRHCEKGVVHQAALFAAVTVTVKTRRGGQPDSIYIQGDRVNPRLKTSLLERSRSSERSRLKPVT